MACDGTRVTDGLPPECLLPENELTFCECNRCQTYGIDEFAGGSPALQDGLTVSTLVPGQISNHTLCLGHWAFITLESGTPDTAQPFDEYEAGVPSAIDPGLERADAGPYALVFTLDTEYDGASQRFTTVELLVADALPPDWYQVHKPNYPASVFSPAFTAYNGRRDTFSTRRTPPSPRRPAQRASSSPSARMPTPPGAVSSAAIQASPIRITPSARSEPRGVLTGTGAADFSTYGSSARSPPTTSSSSRSRSRRAARARCTSSTRAARAGRTTSSTRTSKTTARAPAGARCRGS